ncbi:hypothetical protein SVIOM342S_03087 [Streptomyces violaceorubidus]
MGDDRRQRRLVVDEHTTWLWSHRQNGELGVVAVVPAAVGVAQLRSYQAASPAELVGYVDGGGVEGPASAAPAEPVAAPGVSAGERLTPNGRLVSR